MTKKKKKPTKQDMSQAGHDLASNDTSKKVKKKATGVLGRG